MWNNTVREREREGTDWDGEIGEGKTVPCGGCRCSGGGKATAAKNDGGRERDEPELQQQLRSCADGELTSAQDECFGAENFKLVFINKQELSTAPRNFNRQNTFGRACMIEHRKFYLQGVP